MSRFQTSITQKKKESVDKHCRKRESLHNGKRTVEDIKKKWNDLKSAALNSVQGQTNTRGGPPVKPPSFVEPVLNVIGDQSDAPHGIEGRSY